ncbi:PREDICTED: uncharacterized protein LOC109233712 [Nicotiana attenuata]|uniref:uncharacterized protein LOC109233712 n=1 Tax=Nicotiana attenuata TaxID=49451 RepID=UPI00090483D4|nr:PREDICTED: uncharacterized protein LOC109233712 [Nicotiana attenuata]
MARFECALTSGISTMRVRKMNSPPPIPELMIDATTGKVIPPVSQFEIVYIPQKTIKGQVLADFLAYHPIPDDWELTDELPYEDAMFINDQPPWKMYFDGAAHRGGASAGVVFVTSQGEVLPYSFTLMQLYSNNVTEYQALILGLEKAVEMKWLQLQILGDSHLVVNQLLGSYKVKKPKLRSYHDYAKKLMGWVGDVTIQHVPRKENKKVDALVTLASSLTLPDQVQVTVCQKWLIKKNGVKPLSTTYAMGYFKKI